MIWVLIVTAGLAIALGVVLLAMKHDVEAAPCDQPVGDLSAQIAVAPQKQPRRRQSETVTDSHGRGAVRTQTDEMEAETVSSDEAAD